MEISAEKTKLMTNNTRQKLETVTSFKYLDSVITSEGSHTLQDSTDNSSIDKVKTSLE